MESTVILVDLTCGITCSNQKKYGACLLAVQMKQETQKPGRDSNLT